MQTTKETFNFGYVIGIFIAIGLLATGIKAITNRIVVGDRVDGFVAESTRVSKNYGIYVREYRAIPDELRLGDRVVRINAAWLEKWAEVDYAWVWFLKPKPTGEYRLIIDADCDGRDPSELVFWHDGSPRGFTNAGSISWEPIKTVPNSPQIDVRWHDDKEKFRIQLFPKD